MEFCEECDGMLIPKKGGKELECRICKKVYKVDKTKDIKEEYKISKKMKHKVRRNDILEGVTKKVITEEDRRALEDMIYDD